MELHATFPLLGLKIRSTSNPVTSYFYIGLVLGCIDADLKEKKKEKKKNNTVVPIGRQKVRALFFARKKRTFGEERENAQISAPAVAP